MPQNSTPIASWQDATTMLPSLSKLRARQLASGPTGQTAIEIKHPLDLQSSYPNQSGQLGSLTQLNISQPVPFHGLVLTQNPVAQSDYLTRSLFAEGQTTDIGGEATGTVPELSPEALNWQAHADDPSPPYPSPPIADPTIPPYSPWDTTPGNEYFT